MGHRLSPENYPNDLIDFTNKIRYNFGGLFLPDRDVVIARAPARLDVLGGIADYSGSVVLELPLAESTIVGVQKRRDRRILVKSLAAKSEGYTSTVQFNLDDFYTGDKLKSYQTIHDELLKTLEIAWSAYVLGAFHVLLTENICSNFEFGATIGIVGTIPFGSGVSSSASLEVAVVQALTKAFNIQIDSFQLARLCQILENSVVGAACGIMDQVTTAFGEENKFVVLKCQPHEIVRMMTIPKGIQFIGIFSNVRHAVNGNPYTDTRIATFMGRKYIFHKVKTDRNEQPFAGYLCNVSSKDWEEKYKKSVPVKITGKEFLEKLKSHDDPVTVIDPEKNYRPRSRAEHAIMENERVYQFIEALDFYAKEPSEDILIDAGRLLYESHESYSKNCGLGAKETDVIVDLVKEAGVESGLYGAKITGGGSGGTVAVLARTGTRNVIENIAALYKDATGLTPYVFWGSSPGAIAIGTSIVKF